ncbi:AAA+ ATPase domain [Moorella glycerini]|uniref:Cell division control protein 6 n=1 Tax=Neomoorella stamsii TaxID=1266720 RepID=A0A9X7J5P2_9FIRM|nr:MULTISPECIES: AAA family ATPase [Moorella]PRR77119.1 cell division control protein 6 [Moorella stamsii]CEP66868.1 AAA+ ATPase domain [Moorella glycerini]
MELASRLKYLQQVRGIGLITGEVGCGKTTALRKFLSELNPAQYKACYFALSTVTVLEFYQGLALSLGEEPNHKKVYIFHQIQAAITSLYADRHIIPVIVLDEIHLAANKILEDLRLLFNFQMDSQNPFILILAGQTLFRSRLSLNVNNPLRQRLTVKYFLQGLKPEELKDYCLSRLQKDGLHEDIFTPAAFETIYAITKGLPRLINNLVTTCMICLRITRYFMWTNICFISYNCGRLPGRSEGR